MKAPSSIGPPCNKILSILNNFFNTKFETMVFKNETYRNLYQKRFSRENIGIDDFNSQLSKLSSI